MKRNDIKALAQADVANLQKKLVELSQELAKAKLEKKVGKLVNRRMVSTLGDDIARVKTVLHAKEMEVNV